MAGAPSSKTSSCGSLRGRRCSQLQASRSPSPFSLQSAAHTSSWHSVLESLTSPSPRRSHSVSSHDHQIVKKSMAAKPPISRRRTCTCSPTTHPGSFRCALHKNAGLRHGGGSSVSSPSSRLNARRSAMTNSLARIKTVEGSDLIKRGLASLIQPSSHHQRRRRSAFQHRPSRLSVMSKADDLF